MVVLWMFSKLNVLKRNVFGHEVDTDRFLGLFIYFFFLVLCELGGVEQSFLEFPLCLSTGWDGHKLHWSTAPKGGTGTAATSFKGVGKQVPLPLVK